MDGCDLVFFVATGSLTEFHFCICALYDSSETEMTEPLLEHAAYSERHIETLVDIGRIESNGGMLLLENAVPMLVRHVFPIVVIGTIFLLLASNLSVGASVDIVISSESNQTISLPSLFAFSLGNTVREMYKAGIYALMFLVVIFSGVWPYVKLVLMLFGWFAPTRVLDIWQRGRMLFLLDSLGKFSLVDTFVLVLMMVSFRFHLVLDKFMTLDVFVNPSFGFYGFLLATTLSLIAGHVILYFHRQSLVHIKPLDGAKESLSQHEFQDRYSDSQTQMTWLFSVLIVVVMILAIVFLSIGMVKKSFIFEVGGLAGMLLGDDRRKTYSLLTLGSSLPQSVQDPSSLGITCLQTAYYFYSLIMPFTCLAALGLLFLMPMTLPCQQRMMAVAEIANAWSAVEVFALSIIASLFEISTFASFLVGHKCDLINEFLANHFADEFDDDTCYTVKSSVASNVWYLICGALLNSLTVSFLLKVAHRALNERLERHGDLDKDILAHDDVASHDLVAILLHSRFGGLLFDNSSASSSTEQSEEDARRRSAQGDQRFWEKWREICSVT
jgi:hypothetical protein